VRESHPDDRRTRVVRLTERGWQAADVINQTMDRLETEWLSVLGEETYAGLARALEKLSEHFDQQLRNGS
jgi:DNA-binding MarR family transcriptional regulator